VAGGGRRRGARLAFGLLMLATASSAATTGTERHPSRVAVHENAAPPASPPAASGVRVRGLRVGKRDAAALLEIARLACPTVQRLLDELQETDVIVLVEVRDGVLNGTGHLTFQGEGHGTRYLRITLDGGNRRPELAAWLAHELQHAVEVAAAAGVKNAEGLGRLFTRIGWRVADAQFETDAAVTAGKQALREAYGEGRAK
jgi:hypothetical protein